MKLILVVDDDEFALTAMHQLLSPHYKLALCKYSEEAPKLIEKLSPDLVVTDYQMPGLNGSELAAWIKSSEEYSSIPVIVVSGSSAEKTLDDLPRNLEIDAIVEKGSLGQEFIETISNLLQ